jgi:hypothetical protein
MDFFDGSGGIIKKEEKGEKEIEGKREEKRGNRGKMRKRKRKGKKERE